MTELECRAIYEAIFCGKWDVKATGEFWFEEDYGEYIFTRYRSASDESVKKLKDSFESITDKLRVEPKEFVKWFMNNLDKIIVNPAHTGQICFDVFQ